MSRKFLLKLILIFNLIILMLQKNNKKIAVFFPGLGYHNDKPLLYYSRKIAISNDFIALMQFGELHIDKMYYPIWREQKDAWV